MSTDAKVTLVPFIESSFGENAYVISVNGHSGVWVVDPSFPPQCHEIRERVQRDRKTVEAVLLTHGHADHIAGVDVILDTWPDAALRIARDDAHMLADAEVNLSGPFGFDIVVKARPTGTLEPGDLLTLGPTRWQVLDTSGHSPGGRSLYCATAGVVLTGDALFARSIGRTDFPGSDHQRLIRNIRENLLTLPDGTRIYSGHGPITTPEKERQLNPFVS